MRLIELVDDMHDDKTDGDAELVEFEAALGALRPAAARLNRDRLMFQAGRASSGARLREAALASLAGVMTLVAVTLGGALWQTASRQPSDSEAPLRKKAIAVDDENRPAASRAVAAVPPLKIDPQLLVRPGENYVTVRDLIIARGVDAWPRTRGSEPGLGEQRAVPTRRQLLEQLSREGDASL